ncbi:hypothetical protein ACFSM5_01025 [Lacibacterium aquatile]|uniref:Uncharacterized protein n=1 Tax=Lacibacterium aquatile TaxID=1168082 RepID=A0ABW5DLP3_9PROT
MKRLVAILCLTVFAIPVVEAQAQSSKAKAEQLLRQGQSKKPVVVPQKKANPINTTGATPGRLNPYTNQISPHKGTNSALKAGRCLNGMLSC